MSAIHLTAILFVFSLFSSNIALADPSLDEWQYRLAELKTLEKEWMVPCKAARRMQWKAKRDLKAKNEAANIYYQDSFYTVRDQCSRFDNPYYREISTLKKKIKPALIIQARIEERGRKEQERRARIVEIYRGDWEPRVIDNVVANVVSIGMTMEMVQEAWSRPDDKRTHIFKGHRRQIWWWGTYQSVTFDNGIVTSIYTK